MKKTIILIGVVGLCVSGCANFQASSAKFQADLNTLTGDVVAVNAAIAQISASLSKNCNGIHDAATGLASLASSFNANSQTQGAFNAANAVLSTWCAAPPTDIASAIKVTAAEVVAAKNAYQAAKKS